MKLRYVTLTGADNNTSIQGMHELAKKFPFVEFAILFSQSKSGVARYPDWEWVTKLSESMSRESWLNLSAHMCGKWVDDADKYGKLTRFFNSDEDDEFVGEAFRRVQFNLAGSRLKKILENPESGCWSAGKMDGNFEVIFGGPYVKSGLIENLDTVMFSFRQVAPLFDSSGGRGVLEKNWPKIPHHEYGPIWCGYAGGLGPDNIKEELQRIEEAVGDAEIWIDMETKLRNKQDQFDLSLCEQVLQEAVPYVEVSH